MTVHLPVSENSCEATNGRHYRTEPSSPLHQIREPALLLDAAARVVSGNEAGLAFLGAHPGLRCVGGKLRGLDGETATILQAVADVARATDTFMPVRTVALTSGPDNASLAILLVRWRDQFRHTTSKAANVLAILQANALETISDVDHFGFTSIEAALAGDLIAGLRLKDVALRRGRRITTIRTQLARLMRKTGTTRQAELVSLLLRNHGAKTEAVDGRGTINPHLPSATALNPRLPSFIHLNDNRQGTIRDDIVSTSPKRNL